MLDIRLGQSRMWSQWRAQWTPNMEHRGLWVEPNRGWARIWDHAIGVCLGLLTLWVLYATCQMGFSRDEGFYFHAAKDYLGWFKDLSDNIDKGEVYQSWTQENIDKHWSYNPEHPTLMKSLFGLSYHFFSQKNDWMTPSTAMRFPSLVMVSLMVYVLFLWASEMFGRRVGVFSCVALMSMPHVFFHSHLACFDAPMMAMWVIILWAYWKSLSSRPWAYITAVFWGIGLITKLNAFFLPGVIFFHWLAGGWWQFYLSRRAVVGQKSKTIHFHMPKIPYAIPIMLSIGLYIFYILWPRHWYDSFNRVAWYVERHLAHEHYPTEYFGVLWIRPPFPFEFPFVMSWYTIPLVTMAAFFVGCGAWILSVPLRERLQEVLLRLRAILAGPGTRLLIAGAWALKPTPHTQHPEDQTPTTGLWGKLKSWRAQAQQKLTQVDAWRPNGELPALLVPRDHRATGALFFVAILIPFLIIARPSTPIFGGTKHWMTSMPLMSIIAGVGAVWAVDAVALALAKFVRLLQRPLVRQAAALTLTPIILWPAIRAVEHVHPMGASYFNELIGGHIGAADAEMQPQFWGYTAREALEFINANADPNAGVHFHDALYYAVEMYKEDGLLRKDIRIHEGTYNPGALPMVQYVIYNHERAFRIFLRDMWNMWGPVQPVHVISVDGVPMISVYENPNWKKRAK